MQAQRLFEAGRRKGDRHEVDLPAVACRSDGTKIPVRVLNISYDGCQLATKAWLEVGETITLDLARFGETAVEVRWASENRAGARFTLDEPLLAKKRRHYVPPPRLNALQQSGEGSATS
jgi:hypothetical protein